MRIRKLFPAAVLLLGCCTEGSRGDAASIAARTIVVATTSDPDVLFPPIALNLEARQVTELVYEYLADVGPSMNTIGDSGFVKEIASGWKWSADSSSIAFEINPKAKWQDGPPVTSQDVAFTFSVYRSKSVASSGASSLADIDSVSTPSASTAVFWFRRKTPHQFYDAAAQMLVLPAHVFAGIPIDSLRARAPEISPVGSGRYRLAKWNKSASFELQAVDNHYRGRAIADRLIWIVSPEYSAALTRLLGGEADVFANVRLESVEPLTKSGQFNIVSLPGMDYVFMQLNLTNPVFASRDLRRALTMSIDRAAMVRNLFDTLAAVSIGPTVRAYPTTDTAISEIPYDTARASRILDSLDWKRSASDGMRRRSEIPLRFSAIVPVSSLSRMRMAVLTQEQLRRVGIDMRIEQMDFGAFSERQSKKDFEAAFASWHLPSSTEAVRGAWTTGGDQNFGGYSSRKFDFLIDSALGATTIRASREYFRRAHQVIVDDAPAVWLYEPRTLLAIRKKVQPTAMRPSAWWLDMGSWGVDMK